MLVVGMLADIFGKDCFTALKSGKLKDVFRSERKKANSDKDFFTLCCMYLGGRGYNEFLDYSLFAIKLIHINKNMEKLCGVLDTPNQEHIESAVSRLLWDDRHDMYQNVPFCLERYAKELDDLGHTAHIEHFWSMVADSLIDCINVHGTEDVAAMYVIQEE